MKKFIYTIIAAALLAASCEEWEPVFANQGEPEQPAVADLAVNTTIADLKSLYQGKPLFINDDVIIGGKVTSSDVSGNIYRSLYIQDETGGLEIKIGNSSLYNDYKVGQWVYVKCQGLVLGNYGGMLQVGAEDPTGEYETAYIDVKSLVYAHVFKGRQDTPVSPYPLTEYDVKTALRYSYKSPYFGMYVTLKDLTYSNEIFALLYMDNYADKKASSNRLFLSDQQWGVTTWAMSANKMKSYLLSGAWDEAKIGNSGDYNYGSIGDVRNMQMLMDNASAYAVSQYFTMPGGTEIQIRTSGYAKFADVDIPLDIRNGAKIDVTGILAYYNGAAQFTLIDIDGVKRSE